MGKVTQWPYLQQRDLPGPALSSRSPMVPHLTAGPTHCVVVPRRARQHASTTRYPVAPGSTLQNRISGCAPRHTLSAGEPPAHPLMGSTTRTNDRSTHNRFHHSLLFATSRASELHAIRKVYYGKKYCFHAPSRAPTWQMGAVVPVPNGLASISSAHLAPTHVQLRMPPRALDMHGSASAAL